MVVCSSQVFFSLGTRPELTWKTKVGTETEGGARTNKSHFRGRLCIWAVCPPLGSTGTGSWGGWWFWNRLKLGGERWSGKIFSSPWTEIPFYRNYSFSHPSIYIVSGKAQTSVLISVTFQVNPSGKGRLKESRRVGVWIVPLFLFLFLFLFLILFALSFSLFFLQSFVSL